MADSAEAPERFDHTFILASGSVVCDTDMSFLIKSDVFSRRQLTRDFFKHFHSDF